MLILSSSIQSQHEDKRHLKVNLEWFLTGAQLYKFENENIPKCWKVFLTKKVFSCKEQSSFHRKFHFVALFWFYMSVLPEGLSTRVASILKCAQWPLVRLSPSVIDPYRCSKTLPPPFSKSQPPILKDSLRNKTSCLATGRAERPDCMTPQIRQATVRAWIALTLCELKQNICMPSCDKG